MAMFSKDLAFVAKHLVCFLGGGVKLKGLFRVEVGFSPDTPLCPFESKMSVKFFNSCRRILCFAVRSVALSPT